MRDRSFARAGKADVAALVVSLTVLGLVTPLGLVWWTAPFIFLAALTVRDLRLQAGIFSAAAASILCGRLILFHGWSTPSIGGLTAALFTGAGALIGAALLAAAGVLLLCAWTSPDPNDAYRGRGLRGRL